MRTRTALLGGIGAWAAYRLFGPEIAPRYVPGQERPVHIPGRTVFVGERELFVREAGHIDAPPLVLVHGWGFDGEMNYYSLIEKLAEDFYVVVPDHRNHGKSDWIRGKFDVADLADELAGVLDALGVSRATVVGYSLGGMVTQELARRYPGLVKKMVLAATAARPVHRFRPPMRLGMWLARSFARFSRQEIAAGSVQVMKYTGALDPKNERWMRASLMRRDATLFYEAGHAAWRFDSRAWIGKLPQPAMVIITESDHIVEPVAQNELAELIAGAEVVRLPGADHDSVLSDPASYIEAIRGFAT
ncbi:MAG: alpha/beta hydrolase [bacterium]|nr:alpha/beta hydrolase [bacterium]